MPIKFEKPTLASGIAIMQNKAIIGILYLSLDILFIKPKPLAKAVVYIAIHKMTEYSFL